MDTLKLQTNVPELIALQFAEGRPVASQFGGDQVMFTLTDGRRAYLPPFVAQKIADAGIQPGEFFELCRREITLGNRRSVEYQVKTDVAGTLPAKNVPAAPNGASSARNDARVQHIAPAGAAVHPAPAPAVPAADTAAVAMTAAGRMAIDAVLAIEAYARSRGMADFVFGADNVQKIAVSLYIDLRKGGRA
jgi:hypothetical protein